MIEKVSATFPGQGPQVLDVEALPHEDDRDIALRLSLSFPPGTVLGVSGGRWRVVARGEVEEVRTASSRPPMPPGVDPQPGDLYRPKDPRRKQSGFRIKAVTETHVEADDGRQVSLERLKRYEKIG